jgi:hypothetical protein
VATTVPLSPPSGVGLTKTLPESLFPDPSSKPVSRVPSSPPSPVKVLVLLLLPQAATAGPKPTASVTTVPHRAKRRVIPDPCMKILLLKRTTPTTQYP